MWQVHLWGGARSCEAGLDFYGRPTKGIWFHIPPRKRKIVVVLLNANAVFQYATQATRFAWSSFDASQAMPGVLWINLTFVSAIGCGIASGIAQGCVEGGVRKAKPGEFPPTPMDIALEAWRAERDRIRAEMRERSARKSASKSPRKSPRKGLFTAAEQPAPTPACGAQDELESARPSMQVSGTL